MKTWIFALCFIFVSFSVLAMGPVESATCTPGGEFGNQVVITFETGVAYNKLVIQRSNKNANYVRDLTNFKGGAYRLDLASQGGITGYSVDYKSAEDVEYKTYTDNLNCTVASVEPVVEIEKTAQTTTPTPVEPTQNQVVEQNVEVANTEDYTTTPNPAEVVMNEEEVDALQLQEEKEDYDF